MLIRFECLNFFLDLLKKFPNFFFPYLVFFLKIYKGGGCFCKWWELFFVFFFFPDFRAEVGNFRSCLKFFFPDFVQLNTPGKND